MKNSTLSPDFPFQDRQRSQRLVFSVDTFLSMKYGSTGFDGKIEHKGHIPNPQFAIRNLSPRRNNLAFPLVPLPVMLLQDFAPLARGIQPAQFQVGVHHDAHQLAKANPSLPT